MLFSHVPLARALPDDPERTWQIMRRLARAANNWIAVDELAEIYAKGVLLEQFRWAELEQLVYSNNKWERRLVGSTVARLWVLATLLGSRLRRTGRRDAPETSRESSPEAAGAAEELSGPGVRR